jgi:hypothetical protein
MLRKNENITMSLLSDINVTTASVPANGVVVTPANLPVGSVVITDLGLMALNAAAFAALLDGEQFLIVQGCGSTKPLLKSPVITKGDYTTTVSKHVAATQQISAVGFNGTTGSLIAASNTSFFIKIRKNDNDSRNNSQPQSLYAQYRTDATGTQEELAYGLAVNGNANFSRQPENGYLKFEVLCNDAGATPTGTTTTFTTVNGSRSVAINGTLTNVAVGDSIRFANNTNSAVYKVTAYTASTSITLDRPYSDISFTYAIANVGRITAANAATANFGIRMTGIENAFDVNRFRNYYANRFTPTFSDENVLVSHLQGASGGTGVWQRVAMDEYMTYGFEGMDGQLGVPSTPRDQFVKIPGVGSNTVASSRYGAIQINCREHIDTLVSTHVGKNSVIIYVNLSSIGVVTAASAALDRVVIPLGYVAADLNA